MSKTQTQTVLRTIAQTLLGSIAVCLAVPTGIGPVAGGWLAGHGLQRQRRRIVVSAVAGVVGALPWTVVTFLALTGAIEPVGYHRGVVHVGVLTASPDAFVLWQEVGLSAALTLTVVTFAVAGSVVISLLSGGVRSRRGKLS